MNPFVDALDLRLGLSRRLRLLIVLLHASALVPVVIVGLRVPWLWCLVLLVLLSLAFSVRRLTAPARVQRLQRRPDGWWRWERADGRAGLGRPAGSSVSTPQIVLLHLRAGNRFPVAIAVLPDSLANDHFRRLRVQLRLRG